MKLAVSAFDYSIAFDVQIVTTRNGRVYTYGLPGARWGCTLAFANDAEGTMRRPATEALIVSLKGGANRLQMPHLGRSLPNGTMRGTPVLNGAVIAGAEQLTLSGVNGTLKAGDFIGVPNQLLMVTADASPTSGNMVVLTEPPLFSGYASGTPITWNAPTTLWIPQNSTAGPFPYASGKSRPSFSIDLVEAPA